MDRHIDRVTNNNGTTTMMVLKYFLESEKHFIIWPADLRSTWLILTDEYIITKRTMARYLFHSIILLLGWGVGGRQQLENHKKGWNIMKQTQETWSDKENSCATCHKFSDCVLDKKSLSWAFYPSPGKNKPKEFIISSPK